MNSVSAEVHVFGTDGGYRTLASSKSLADSESVQLQAFDFAVDSMSSEASRAFEEAGSAFLLPLASGRLAIRRILSDNGSDNYGRRGFVVVSLVLAASEYLRLVEVDDGPGGLGLEGLIRHMDFWRSLGFGRRGDLPPATVPVARRDTAVRRLHPEDLEIFDAWRAARRGPDERLWVPLNSTYESRVLALPSLLPPKMAVQFHWGFAVMRCNVPGLVASYIDPALVPRGASPIAVTAVGEFKSKLTREAIRLMLHFPETTWYPHDEHLALQDRLSIAEKQLQQQGERFAGELKERGKVLLFKDTELKEADKQKTALSEKCISLGVQLRDQEAKRKFWRTLAVLAFIVIGLIFAAALVFVCLKLVGEGS